VADREAHGDERTVRAVVALALAAAATACASLPAGEAAAAQRYADREAIAATLQRYMVGIDSMDEALYENAFAEDATFELNGQVYEGREAIGDIIVGVRNNREARLAQAAADGSPPPNTLFHIMMNSRIGFLDADTAIHRSYYETISQAPDGTVRIGAIGRYEDVLEKRDGEWLIAKRLLVPNAPAEPVLP
jgi:hypothetical protein